MEGSQTPYGKWRTRLYSQVPLRLRNGDMRLLTIQPRNHLRSTTDSETTDQISIPCFLRLANLKNGRSKFMAISHDCDNREDQSLSINGALVPASQSLVDLLAVLQHETDPVTVWIDVLCVNYNDVEEKSTQMAQVADIFSAATGTAIWLGSAADDSDAAMGALDQLVDEHLTPAAQKFLLNALRRTPLLATEPSPNRDRGETVQIQADPSDKKQSFEEQLQTQRTSFQSLMDRKYWSRFWSLQELVFTAKGVVMCGSRTLSLDRFYLSAGALEGVLNMATYSKWLASGQTPAAPSVLDTSGPADFSKAPAIRVLAERNLYRSGQGWWSSTNHSLLSILDRYLVSKPKSGINFPVTEDQDLLYSLIGLATDARELGIAIDYSKDYAQICLETTIALLRQNPNVLYLCNGLHDRAKHKPSWLVDWSMAKKPLSWDSGCSFNACGPADSRFYRVDACSPGIIALKGVHLDIVQDVKSAEPSHSENSEELLPIIDRLFKQSLEMTSSPYLADQEPNIPPVMSTNTSFITRMGYVGCGQNITTGDLIAILYGAELPFVLKEQNDKTYRIVGEVYVHGVMQGEFMRAHRTESIIRIS